MITLMVRTIMVNIIIDKYGNANDDGIYANNNYYW